MNCPMENRESDELPLNYVSGALDTHQAALFEQHMLSCAVCAKFAREQKAVWGALDLFEPVPVSADFDRRLYQRIDQVATNNASWWDRMAAALRSPMLARRGLPIAAAAAVLVAAGVIWERPFATTAKPQTPLSAEVDNIQPDQVQHALDDMEMLREFNHLMRSDAEKPKM